MTSETAQQICATILAQLERAVVGKRRVLESVLVAVLAGGHILFEDLPGLGKTLTAKSLAQALGLAFKRIQFTPDLLPADITGGMVFNRAEGTFEVRRGPLFADFVLADEINRASPRTQSALLEAMQERHVTIDGRTIPLPRHFTVVATQNPVEYEGTFPLPEAQLDRFLVRLHLGYPDADHEREMLRRRRERRAPDMTVDAAAEPVVLEELRAAVEDVHVGDAVERYIVALVTATRIQRGVAVGASPRGALALQDAARAAALLEGRAFVLPDDVKRMASAVLAHRIVLEPSVWAEQAAAYKIVEAVVESTPVPALE